MEREYIFFHTGAGLLILFVGILLSVFGVLFVIDWVPESKWIHILVILLSSIVAAWAAYRVDEWSVKRRKRNLITMGIGSNESKDKRVKRTHRTPPVR
jgi:peptidoglycan/LPS O-acetylase OafA/YrhL